MTDSMASCAVPTTPGRIGLAAGSMAGAIGILLLLAGVVLPSLNRAESRDQQRLDDIGRIHECILEYQQQTGTLPGAGRATQAGWDSSLESDFLDELVEQGFMKAVPCDPLNDADYHYLYTLEAVPGSVTGAHSFVLGFSRFEGQGDEPESEGGSSGLAYVVRGGGYR